MAAKSQMLSALDPSPEADRRHGQDSVAERRHGEVSGGGDSDGGEEPAEESDRLTPHDTVAYFRQQESEGPDSESGQDYEERDISAHSEDDYSDDEGETVERVR